MKLISLQEHARFLATRERVRVFAYPYKKGEARPNAASSRIDREVFCPPVSSVSHYWLLLHEIGHVSGAYQDPGFPLLLREAGAWRWAQEHALFWNSRASSFMRKGLQSYSQRYVLPEASHHFWTKMKKISNLRRFVNSLRQ